MFNTAIDKQHTYDGLAISPPLRPQPGFPPLLANDSANDTGAVLSLVVTISGSPLSSYMEADRIVKLLFNTKIWRMTDHQSANSVHHKLEFRQMYMLVPKSVGG